MSQSPAVSLGAAERPISRLCCVIDGCIRYGFRLMYQGGFLVSDVACSLIIDGCRLGLSVRLTHRHTHTHTHTLSSQKVVHKQTAQGPPYSDIRNS